MKKNDLFPERQPRFLILIFVSLLISWILFCRFAHAQTIGDGFPEKTGTTTPRNIVYSDVNGNIVSEVFNAPDIKRDFADVTYLLSSPLEADRAISSLPTFGLAIWHWWLFGSEILPHAQRDYARCVGEIRAYQKLLKMKPLIDEPGSPLYDLVMGIEHYLVPFHVVERFDFLGGPTVPPGIDEAKAHARAAIDSINITVFHHGLCESTAAVLKTIVESRMR